MANGDVQRLELLVKRQSIVRSLRDYLFEEGFLEIQSPLLVRGTTPDPAIDSFAVGDRYLVTSTEYQLKRLEMLGVDKPYSLTQNFRAGEVSPRHNPEFTMLEWARVGASLSTIERDAEVLIQRAYRTLYPQGRSLTLYGREVSIDGAPWQKLTVREGFERYLGFRVDERFSLESMRGPAAELGLPERFAEDQALTFSFLLDRLGESLGSPVPTFLREWPAFSTSSAALVEGASTVAQRSELFIAGLEIADGFPSLRGAALQRTLFEQAQAMREREGKAKVALDDRYLAAMDTAEGMPVGAGMALGVDRLTMVLTEQEEIRSVLAFAWDET